MSPCSLPDQRRPSRAAVLYLNAAEGRTYIKAGGRPSEMIEEALTTSQTVTTYLLEEDGSLTFESWPDQ
jgi:reverse gyrase